MESEQVNAVVRGLAVVIIAAGVLGLVSHFLRQPLLVAYIVCGVLIGPHGPFSLFAGVEQPEAHRAADVFLDTASSLGILFLLFLIGLVLNPGRLKKIVGSATLVALGAGLILFVAAFGLTLALGQPWHVAMVMGLAAMFSSTILVVKLLPTRKLHESPVGTICVGVLILQDLLAILAMVVLRSVHEQALDSIFLLTLLGKLAAIVAAAFLFERWVLRWLLARVERYPELVFVLGLAWCFVWAESAEWLNLSRGIGAFLAGVSLARNPLSLYISEKVAPLRDFFVVLFFFALGARLDLPAIPGVILQAAIMAAVLMVLKPLAFRLAFRLSREPPGLSREAAVRLSQMSEFSLIIAWLALELTQIGAEGVALVQTTCLLTMIASTYWVVLRYPSPLAVSNRLKQN